MIFLALRTGLWIFAVAMLAAHAADAGQALESSGPSSNVPRVALVIGNEAYRDSLRLKNPVRDAREMAKALEDAGFTVTTVENGTADTMQRAVAAFAQSLPESAIVVVYFAGNGQLTDGRLLALPVDFAAKEKAPTVDLTTMGETVAARLNHGVALWLFDAGFTTPGANPMSELRVPPNTVLAFASGLQGAPSDDGLFTAALVKAIRGGTRSTAELLRQAQGDVIERTDGGQVPWSLVNATLNFQLGKPAGGVDSGRQSPTTR
jgi:hypothetical protein